jgi:hypothetical protein
MGNGEIAAEMAFSFDLKKLSFHHQLVQPCYVVLMAIP